MCEHHRNLGVREIEEPPTRNRVAGTERSSFTQEIADVHATRQGVARFLSEPRSMPSYLDEAIALEDHHAFTPSTPKSTMPVRAEQPTNRVAPPAPQPAPEAREPAWFRPKTPASTGTLRNPNKVRKSERTNVTSGNIGSSTLKPDGTVNVDALLSYIHSVPPKGGRHKKRR
jgi:hypothetical protein